MSQLNPGIIPGGAGVATVIFVDQIKKQGAADGLQAENFRRYQYFLVKLNQPDDEGADVALFGGAAPYGAPVPALGEPYGGASFGAQNLVVINRHCRPFGTGGVSYEVEIEYGIDISVASTSQIKPWQRVPVVRWKT